MRAVVILIICVALAFHLHNTGVNELAEMAVRKREEKGGFDRCLGLFVKVVRHGE